MGTWGIKMDQNDTFCSICESFKKMLYDGMDLNLIVDKIIHAYEDDPDAHIAYFAVAECMWRCNQLSDDIYKQVLSIREKGVDHDYWYSLGADEKTLNKRKEYVNKFIKQLSLNPAQNQLWDANKMNLCKTLNKGDVFWYKCKGVIYGAIILEKISDIEFYLIAISEQLERVPQETNEIVSSLLYTIAWFSDIDILPYKRIHKISSLEIMGNYNHRAGLTYDAEGLSIRNVGQSQTWKHLFRSFNWDGKCISAVLDPNRLPYFKI